METTSFRNNLWQKASTSGHRNAMTVVILPCHHLNLQRCNAKY